MKRWLTLVLLFAAVPLALGQEDRDGPMASKLPPFERLQLKLPGGPGREARVMAIGNGRSALAIYVYDQLGNCVAFDDEPTKSYDDRIVAFVRSASDVYDVEIRNLGPVANHFEMSQK